MCVERVVGAGGGGKGSDDRWHIYMFHPVFTPLCPGGFSVPLCLYVTVYNLGLGLGTVD